jgi:hypothetical protein
VNIRDNIVRLQAEICSKVMRSGYYEVLDPPLDMRIDVEDVTEDLLKLRQLQDLETDMIIYGTFKAEL